MLHFLKDWWKFIQIHQCYTMVLMPFWFSAGNVFKSCMITSCRSIHDRPYALTSSRRHVGRTSHGFVRACDLQLAHFWQLRLSVILLTPREGTMRLWRHMHRAICCRSHDITSYKHIAHTRPETWHTRKFGSHTWALWRNPHVYDYGECILYTLNTWTSTEEIHMRELVWC